MALRTSFVVMSRLSPESQQALEVCTLAQEGEIFHAMPRERVLEQSGLEKLIFEVWPRHLETLPSSISRWWSAVRPSTLLSVLLPCLSILGLGLLRSLKIHWDIAALTLTAVLCLRAAVNLLNDVSDHFQLIDLIGRNRGSGVIQKGWLLPAEMRAVGWLLFGFGVLLGVPALMRQPVPILIFGVIGLVGLLAVSGSALALKIRYQGFGPIAAFFLAGPILSFGFGFSAFEMSGPEEFWVGILSGLSAALVVMIGSLQDHPVDQKQGFSTLPSLVGFQTARNSVIALLGMLNAGFFLLGYFEYLPKFAVYFPLLTAGSAWIFAKRILGVSGPISPHLVSARVAAMRLHLLWQGLFLFGVLVTLLIRK